MRRMFSEKQIEELIKGQPKDIDTLVDKDGHPRFIDGDIEIKEIAGISKQYGKWSLSGSHLLIVLCLDIEDATTLAASTVLADINVPQWILDKIVPIFSGIAYVETKTISWFGTSWTEQIQLMGLRKPSSNLLHIRTERELISTSARSCRIAFDLLIDNE